MFMLLTALATAASNAEDFEDDLLPIAIGLAVIAFLYAAVATWMVTAKDDPAGH